MSLLLWLITVTTARGCDPVEIRVSTLDARKAFLDGDPRDALTLIGAAVSGLQCQQQWVTPEEIAGLLQTGATLAERSDARDQASRWMTDAARMAGTVPFDPDLGDEAARRYGEILRSMDLQKRTEVRARSTVRLDGVTLERGASRAVIAGSHLVQELGADGRVHTDLVEIGPGASTDLGSAVVAPAPPHRLARTSLALAGTALSLGGVASFWVAADRWNERDELILDGAADGRWAAADRAVNLYYPLGTGLVVAGASTLLGTSFLAGEPSTHILQLGMRW